ncbi:sugar-transfer associated ATP-grasp domain-containing protein [Rheinheimera sp. NSM]|uniref:sugar-transfer associated ATP-grasp domain-containing protein n=1 Tax=Rheinheimera sp. NSM TaxID=3457884 RepID=UPI0040351C21
MLKLIYWRIAKVKSYIKNAQSLKSYRGKRGEQGRKPAFRRFIELLYISLRYDESSTAYFAQGIDYNGKSVLKDYYSTSSFNTALRKKQQTKNYRGLDYSILFEDKLVFEKYFSANNIPCTFSEFVLMPDLKLFDTAGNFCGYLHENTSITDSFCKPVAGRYGSGAFRLYRNDNTLMVNGEALSTRNVVIKSAMLIQKRIIQHDMLSKFHPGSLNTIRVVSIIDDEQNVSVIAAFFRMGNNGSVVDNASAGGVVCDVDTESGMLGDIGYMNTGRNVEQLSAHPCTNIRFKDGKIPYFDQIIKMVTQAHKVSPWIFSVGWDVAIAQDGPVIIEGNEKWGPVSLMWCKPDFIKVIKTHLHSGT